MEPEMTQEESQDLAAGKKALLVFWLRMVGWILTGTVAPITTFAIKFGLFTEYGYDVTTDELGNVTGMKIALNGWGIISILLIALTVSSVLKEILEAHSKYSMTKQCIQGAISRIIPLAVALGITYYISGVIQQVEFCLAVMIISQCAAIPLNPLPAWKYKKLGEESYNDIWTEIVKIIKKRGGK